MGYSLGGIMLYLLLEIRTTSQTPYLELPAHVLRVGGVLDTRHGVVVAVWLSLMAFNTFQKVKLPQNLFLNIMINNVHSF